VTVHLWDDKLTYVSVPKCGCTSLKMFFHEVARGVPFPENSIGDVHQVYRSRSFLTLPHYQIRQHTKVAVIRDPVSRVYSAYKSKVVNERCLSRPRVRVLLGTLGLSVEPSFSEFLGRIRTYMCVSPVIFRHCQKLSYYLGRRADWFTQIYDLSQVSALRDYMNQRSGGTVTLPFVNRSRAELQSILVSEQDQARILALYRDDVTHFGRYYKIPAPAG
jgi:hypothetical protein